MLVIPSLVGALFVSCGADDDMGGLVPSGGCVTHTDCESGCCLADYTCAEDPGACSAQTCPGAKTPLTVGKEVYLKSDALLEDDLPGACLKPDHPEFVFQLLPAAAGTLAIIASAGAVELRSDCASRTKVLACLRESDELVRGVEREPVYLIATPGAYDEVPGIRVLLTPPACGDRALNADEECDLGDRNGEDESGCTEDCKFAGVAVEAGGQHGGDECGAEELFLTGSAPRATLNGYTFGYADDTGPACHARPGGADRFYKVGVGGSGLLKVTLEAEFDAVLSIYSLCDAGRADGLLRCADGAVPSAVETLEVPVVKGKGYHIGVDGYSETQQGPFKLSVEFKP
jgi:hypothetical protein